MTAHLSRAVALLKEHGLSSALLQSPADLLYCTGLNISQGTLLVGSASSTLFLDGRYFELGKKLPIDVVLIKEPQDLYLCIEKAFARLDGKVGFNPQTMSVATHQKILACCKQQALESSTAYYADLRRQKDVEEIEAIRKACSLCEKGLKCVLSEIRSGVSEKALASKLKMFWFEHEAQNCSFEPIIAFDVHTSFPHWRPSEAVLGDRGTILIDIGVQRDNYHSDLTRMVFFGQPDEELLKCYDLVKGAYEKAVSFAAPGVTPHHLDSIAREYIKEHGYGKFFVHGLGHGVGLEVHEPPRLSNTAPQESPLISGDVFTIEPGIYLPGRGGVRLENTILLEDDGAKSLVSFPTDPVILP